MKNQLYLRKYICLGLLFLMSCQLFSDKKTLDFGSFTIEVPKNWKAIERKGVDSYVGEIAIDESDTLYFDLGWYSSKLEEQIIIDDDRMLFRSILGNYRFIGYVGDKMDTNSVRQHVYTYVSIDSKGAKIVKPKTNQKGITGIYIDSLWVAGSDNARFKLSGYNLKPKNETDLLSALKTLKFKRKN